MKFVRALLAAAVALGAAAAVQVATATPASAQQATGPCGGCWWIIVDN